MTFLLLCSALCTVAGGALGAAWRRADAKYWHARYLEEKLALQHFWTDCECWQTPRHSPPTHELPMSCHLGSRPSESVRREGPTVARTLDQLMEER